jgi:hypothetical protein
MIFWFLNYFSQKGNAAVIQSSKAVAYTKTLIVSGCCYQNNFSPKVSKNNKNFILVRQEKPFPCGLILKPNRVE